jgi:hypothetical protein
VSSARLRGGRCFVQVTYDARYRVLDGEPRLHGIHQLAALNAEGWLPPVSCRCCRSVRSQAKAAF